MINIFYFSLIYSVLIACIYFSKKKIDNEDNKIYSRIIIVTIIGIILDILQYYAIKYNFSSIITLILNKGFLIYLLTWMFMFSKYVFCIGESSKIRAGKSIKLINVLKNVSFIFYVFSVLVLIILPISIQFNGKDSMYTYGSSVMYLQFSIILYLIVMLGSMIMNARNNDREYNRKYIPLVVFVILGFIALTLQMINPYLLLTSSVEAFITFLTYFFIENPDVKMIQELEVAKEQADKANRAKTDFLSSMSHEIRTPLNAIVGFSDCIMDANDLGEAKENARDIINASQTLLEIVNGILDISKIEAGKIEIVNSPYDANLIFNELAKLIIPKMKEKGLDFSFYIAPDLPKTLYGDHANLKKVVTNLLSNACKYTDRGFVRYEVNCVNSKDVSKLIISVEDSGRGIKKENIDKMFTKFQRLDEDRNTTIEGTGLGLAITKQLVELMGGRIIVHTVYGEGSKFTIVLNQKIEKSELIEKKKVKTTLDLHDVRILLVDDTELNLKVANKLLEKYNANNVISCNSGFECLERIKRGEVYDLILLDDMMPKMSGVETLKKLKEIEGFSVPTVALTANAITGMREKYLADGFDDYLAKPIEKEQLIQVVNTILGRSLTEEFEILDFEDENSYEPVRDDVIPVEVNVDTEILEINETVEKIEEPPVISKEEYLKRNGVSLDDALELLGDMEMYDSTIKDFLTEIDDKWASIEEYKLNNDMENYAILVHSLKSDCKYLGFMKLAELAYNHEMASKNKDSNYVNQNFNSLEEEFIKVLGICKNYVEDSILSE